jgi:choline dehydrogenase-like flavoprotein
VIRNANELRAGARLRADVCIIGAGAAGITLARELSGSGPTVVLLESGGLEPDPATQDLYAGTVTGTPFGDFDPNGALAAVRLRYFGGTTGHWAGFCRPLDPIDFEPRSGPAPSGWPLNRSDLDPWYEQALEVLGIGPAEFTWAQWQERVGRSDPFAGTELIRTDAYQVRPLRFGDVFRDELAVADDIDVVLDANLVELVLDGDRVSGVRAATLDGGELTVEATEFVLALGGIENARMLLASNGQRPAGIGNENDLVGRYFCEHPQAIIGVATAAADPELLRAVFEEGISPPGSAADPPVVIRGVIVPTEEAARSGGLLSFGVQALAGAVQSDSPVAVSGLSAGDVAVFDEVSQGLETPGVLYLLVTGEQELHPDSRVTLTDERDALGTPRSAVDWKLTAEDRRSMLDGLRLIGSELGRLGLGRVQLTPGNLGRSDGGGFEVDPAVADPDGFAMGIGFHHLCTTRMAADPAEGVVDADLRVHSVDNLSVAGSSSFATAGSAPPTFTIVALALRLAQALRGRLT